ncbi:hypothetical protein [Streptomyces sp. NPDC014764]
MLATATRYTDGAAYTQTVDGYTKNYQPTSTTLALPQSLADTWGFKTSYKYAYAYDDTGALEEASLPVVGPSVWTRTAWSSLSRPPACRTTCDSPSRRL